MLHVTVAGWAVTLGVVAAALVLDWYVHGRHPHEVHIAEATKWSAVYIGIALAFGVAFGVVAGWDLGAQYFAGYLVEKSLSVDNLLVFMIIITAFAVPAQYRPKALTIGITVALGLRAVFIALGAALLSLFSFMFLIFGLALLATSVALLRHRDEDPHVEDNPLVVLVQRVMPVSGSYDGARLVTRRDGRRMLTPLFLVLVAIGSTDVLFAFDSIPAVFGVTKYGYIVFAANAFALLGLRPLFFLVSGLLDRFVYLSTGLAVILAFIGIKLVLQFAHHEDSSIPEISTAASLAFVAAVLTVTAGASAVRVRRDPAIRARAGSLWHRRGELDRREQADENRRR